MKRIIDVNPETGDINHIEEISIGYSMDDFLGFRSCIQNRRIIKDDVQYVNQQMLSWDYKPELSEKDFDMDFLVARDVTPCQVKESDPEWMKRISSSQYKVFNNTYI
jgi:hypothetical protein